jgi:hypothetical protein
MKRKISHQLLFYRQAQLDIPFTSLAKAILTFFHQKNKSPAELYLTEENKIFISETAKVFLQILMSQIKEAPQQFAASWPEYRDIFKKPLNGIKIYISHRDDSSFDDAKLDFREIEDLKEFREIMAFWLTDLKENNRAFALNILEESPLTQVADEARKYSQGKDIIPSLINLEEAIANELGSKCNLDGRLLLTPSELSEEKHYDLKEEFPFLKYLGVPEFIEFLGCCYIDSKYFSSASPFAIDFYNSIVEPKQQENVYADGQTMLYSVLLKNKLNLSDIAELMNSPTQRKEVSFSCLIRTCISLSLKESRDSLFRFLKKNPDGIFTSFILYARVIKIAHCKLDSKSNEATISEIEKLEAEIENLFLIFMSYKKTESLFYEIKKNHNVRSEQGKLQLRLKLKISSIELTEIKQDLKTRFEEIISELKAIESSICQQYDNEKNETAETERPPESQKPTTCTNGRIKIKKQRNTLAPEAPARARVITQTPEKKPSPSVIQYTEETKRCQTILSDETTPLLDQANHLLSSIDEIQAPPGRKAKKTATKKKNGLTVAMQRLQHWKSELKKGKPLKLHEGKVHKGIETLKKAIEDTKKYIDQHKKSATQAAKSSTKSRRQIAPVKSAPLVSPSRNTDNGEKLEDLSIASSMREPAPSEPAPSEPASPELSPSEPASSEPAPLEPYPDENTTTESEDKTSDDSTTISDSSSSFFSTPPHWGVNATPTEKLEHPKFYQLFP